MVSLRLRCRGRRGLARRGRAARLARVASRRASGHRSSIDRRAARIACARHSRARARHPRATHEPLTRPGSSHGLVAAAVSRPPGSSTPPARGSAGERRVAPCFRSPFVDRSPRRSRRLRVSLARARASPAYHPRVTRASRVATWPRRGRGVAAAGVSHAAGARLGWRASRHAVLRITVRRSIAAPLSSLARVARARARTSPVSHPRVTRAYRPGSSHGLVAVAVSRPRGSRTPRARGSAGTRRVAPCFGYCPIFGSPNKTR